MQSRQFTSTQSPAKTSSTAGITQQLNSPPLGAPSAPSSAVISTAKIQYNKLQFGKVLGEGSFCTVYEGHIGPQSVAIKCLEERHEIEAFTQEAKMLMELNHPSIIQCWGWTDLPNPVMALELAEKNLTDYVIECAGQTPKWGERLQYVYDIASALAYLHKTKNTIHADIKPDNVVLVPSVIPGDSVAKLCDFGFAKKLLPLETSAEICRGTPGYMAPEILRERKISKASDIYALAMTAWNLTSTEGILEAYPGRQCIEVIMGVADGRLPPPLIPDSCPYSLSQLITWGWKQKPEDRPTADQVVDLLKPHVARK